MRFSPATHEEASVMQVSDQAMDGAVVAVTRQACDQGRPDLCARSTFVIICITITGTTGESIGNIIGRLKSLRE